MLMRSRGVTSHRAIMVLMKPWSLAHVQACRAYRKSLDSLVSCLPVLTCSMTLAWSANVL